MDNKQNLHIHTIYSDGKDVPEEVITEAINKGFTSIGFSEHSFVDGYKSSVFLQIDDMPSYKKHIYRLKEKYKNKLDIFYGLEYDIFSDISTKDFDYLIGSVHCLEINGQIIPFDYDLKKTEEFVSRNFGKNGLMFAKQYFETVSMLPEKHSFDIIGHFDLCAKNNTKGKFFDTSSIEYIRYGFDAIHNLKGKIPLFEVNTGAIARGYMKNPYPQIEFLQEFKKCGFGVVINSDCHDKKNLDCYFEEARNMLISAGFKSRFILTDNGFKEVEI